MDVSCAAARDTDAPITDFSQVRDPEPFAYDGDRACTVTASAASTAAKSNRNAPARDRWTQRVRSRRS